VGRLAEEGDGEESKDIQSRQLYRFPFDHNLIMEMFIMNGDGN
jgi:hypothetical protein